MEAGSRHDVRLMVARLRRPVLAKRDWAALDAAHGGGNNKDNYIQTDKSGYIHKTDAAEKMYGTGSSQHQAATAKWGKGDGA